MPRPLPGMVTVAEFGDRFTAELMAARLADDGIEATVLGDPAAAVAPHHVTERWFSLCVRAEAADVARTLMADAEPPRRIAYHELVPPRRFRDRPRWIRVCTWALILAVPVPLLISLGLLVLLVTRALFP